MVGVSGRLGLVFFDDQGQVRQTAVLAAAGTVCGVNIPYGLYHTVLALDPGTVMLEAKAGPYLPLLENERAAWAGEDEPAAAAYAQSLRERFAGA